MRRWNGWGDDSIETTLPPRALELLETLVGPGTPRRDATLDEVVAAVPASRLAPDPRLDDDPIDRVRHARGQSLPDWIALRSGRLGAVPDAVARPPDAAAVADLFGLSDDRGAALLPYGGGTSVVGGVTVRPSDRPVITVDLGATAGLHGLDETSRLATFGAGTSGSAVEAALEPHGLTLGHYPQSFEASTVGGWASPARPVSSRAASAGIEDLFAGGHLETPRGPFDLATHPASAAGPDLREAVLGVGGAARGPDRGRRSRPSTPGAGTLQRLPPPGLGPRAPPRSPAGPVGPAALHGPCLHPARDSDDLRVGRGQPRDRRPAPLSRLARDGAGALSRHRRPDRRRQGGRCRRSRGG